MRVLVLYGTTEGQTRKISEFVSDRLKAIGHEASLVDAGDATASDIKLRDFEGVFIAASVHAGRYQSAVQEFVRSRHQTLNGMRTAFLSVSLSAASKDPDDIKGIAECVRQFTIDTLWKPGEIHHVAGAFRFTQYDFFKRWGMKLIAYQKGVSTDTSHDQEMTDWIALARTVDEFVAKVAKVKEQA
jgi:menaquinone-dependent protoporphyrinogen oxidase